MDKKLIELLPELCQRLDLITEYDLCRTTESEMIYLLAQKINDLMVKHNDDMVKVNDKFIQYDDKLRYLLEQGLVNEIKKIISAMYADGTLQELVQGAMVDVNKKIEENKIKIEENKIKIEENKIKIEENKIKIEKKTNGIYNLKEFEVYAVNGDWALAFNHILKKEGGEIYVPPGSYSCKTSIKMNEKFNIRGQKVTSKLIAGPNITLFDMAGVGSERSNRGNVSNLQLIGTNKTGIGLNISCWNLTINDIEVSNFSKGIVIDGVLVDFRKCWIHRNNIGIEIRNQVLEGNKVFSTMITIDDCLIHYNTDVGVLCTDRGVSEDRPLVGLYVNRTAFEWNNRAFDFSTILRCAFRDCWLEQNTLRPRAYATGWLILENMRYEVTPGKPQEIEFRPTTGIQSGSGGYSELIGNKLTTKYLELQEYDNTTATLSGKKVLESRKGRLMYGKDILTNADCLNTVKRGNNLDMLEVKANDYYMFIDQAGEIVAANFAPGTTVAKTGTGTYKITLNKSLKAPIINITGMPAGGDVNTFINTLVKCGNSTQANYVDFNSVDIITIKLVSGETEVAGKISLNIKTETEL